MGGTEAAARYVLSVLQSVFPKRMAGKLRMTERRFYPDESIISFDRFTQPFLFLSLLYLAEFEEFSFFYSGFFREEGASARIQHQLFEKRFQRGNEPLCSPSLSVSFPDHQIFRITDAPSVTYSPQIRISAFFLSNFSKFLFWKNLYGYAFVMRVTGPAEYEDALPMNQRPFAIMRRTGRPGCFCF